MRAWQKGQEDNLRERYLGEIAPLLAAARTAESLSTVERTRIRKRVLRTVFGLRSVRRRVRLTPVLVGLGLLVIGGMAFATAEHLGLIRALSHGQPAPNQTDVRVDHGKLRGARQTTSEAKQAAVEHLGATAMLLPEVADPLLAPLAKAGASGPALPGNAPDRNSPVIDSPAMKADGQTGSLRPAGRAKPAQHSVRHLSFAAPPPRLHVAETLRIQPVLWGTSDPASPAALDESASPRRPVVLEPVFSPRPAAAAKPAGVVPMASDQGLFGQAMRKLRWEHDPAAALGALQDHARAYPNSTLSGERSLLEVEALLALHREGEALVRLDVMTVEELPRSGERFVVRGELRASAQRWLEASADFDEALARVSGSSSWHERALWGRAVARLRCGEREAGLADMELYRDTYPKGRFAAEAAKFFPHK